MAQAARAYDYRAATAPARAPRRDRRELERPDVRVIPGGKVQHKTLAPAVVSAFKVVVAAMVLLISVCSVRVWLSASTVQTLQSVESLQSHVEKAYASGSELEIEHSVLASPARIQKAAKGLGMSAPDKKVYLKVRLSPKFATNADGSVSLKGTIKNIKESNAVKSK